MLPEILPKNAALKADEERRLLERLLGFVEEFEPGGADAKAIRDLIDHLAEMFLLVVVGEVKAGKSSFINALLGAELCPEGPLPMTDRVCVLGYGATDSEVASEPHVVRRNVPIEAIRRMNVVDTPGTNSPLKRHQEITESFLPRADIVFFVTSIDCPLTQTEIRLLGNIRKRWKKEVACILAKTDMRPEKDRELVLEYLRDSFREYIGFCPPVFPVSAQRARQARAAGDAEALEASGVPAVERYIVENLSEERRILLKLRSPLGTVADILTRIDGVAAARLRVLEEDFAGWNAVSEQASFAATSLKERAERHMARIMVSFENLEARGRHFLHETIRLRNLRLFADAGRFKEAFELEVVRDAAGEIELRVEETGAWLASETRALWERSLDHFTRTVSLARYRDEIAAGAGLKFRQTREETLSRMVENARRDMANRFDVDRECRRIRGLAGRSIARLLGTEVVAAGVGTAVAATLLPSVLGGFGLLLAAGVAAGGFFILPSRRRKAVEGFERAVRATRDAVLAALREAVSAEADRAAAAVLDGFTPFHDFYQSRRRRLEALRAQAQGLREDVARFQTTIE